MWYEKLINNFRNLVRARLALLLDSKKAFPPFHASNQPNSKLLAASSFPKTLNFFNPDHCGRAQGPRIAFRIAYKICNRDNKFVFGNVQARHAESFWAAKQSCCKDQFGDEGMSFASSRARSDPASCIESDWKNERHPTDDTRTARHETFQTCHHANRLHFAKI